MYYHTRGKKMAASKIAITIDKNILKRVDILVKSKLYPNRSKAIQEAVAEKITKLEKNRLALECEKLDPKFEQSVAEEGFLADNEEWPEY
jgi:Arc/MetJ-type ribon-helix-helix transcriptional regulator